MSRPRSRIVPILALLFAMPLAAQERPAESLTLDRIFASNELAAAGAGPIRFLADGSGFTRLEPRSPGAAPDLVLRSLPAGERSVVAAAADLVPEGEESPLVIVDYAWSPDGERLLLFTNAERVWRDATRGDYWLFEPASKRLVRLGGDAPPSSMMFAKFTPDGARVGYVQENDLRVQDLETLEITRLTGDGSRTIVNGTTDWVYEEELALRDAFRFDPAGERVAYWRFDKSGVGTFLMIDNLSGPYSRTVPVEYPKVGTTNSAVSIGVVSANGGETVWMKIPGDPREHYLARAHWTPDGRELLVQQLDREQSEIRVWRCDPETGEARRLFTEKDEAWVDVREENDLHWIDGGRAFLWPSERDGWRHLWRVSLDTGDAELVTRGDWDLIETARIDEGGGWVYLIASPDEPTRRFLYRVPLEGGAPERVTPKALSGWNTYQISPDARWAVHTRSGFGDPPRVELVRLSDHATLETFVDNAELRARLGRLGRGELRWFRAPAEEGVELDGWMMLPPDFDPTKRYPVLVHVYGEPWSQTVTDDWKGSRYLWHLFMSRRGYVVLSLDNRGTPAPRGRAWRKHVHRGIGVHAPVDQARALEAALAKNPFLDPERVGIWGWSGGGSMSLHAIFRFPKLYRSAVSVAPVTDLRLYDTIYEERYMGLPKDNPEGYRLGSPVSWAQQLEGDLLLIHGTADDNVHYQNAEILIDALIAHDKVFEMMAYPNRSHSIHERANTRRHLFRTITGFLERTLPPGPRDR